MAGGMTFEAVVPFMEVVALRPKPNREVIYVFKVKGLYNEWILLE